MKRLLGHVRSRGSDSLPQMVVSASSVAHLPQLVLVRAGYQVRPAAHIYAKSGCCLTTLVCKHIGGRPLGKPEIAADHSDLNKIQSLVALSERFDAFALGGRSTAKECESCWDMAQLPTH